MSTTKSNVDTSIVFIPGIKTDDKYLRWWKSYFNETYPENEVVFIEGRYEYTQHDILLDKKQEVIDHLERLTQKGNVVVLTHSYGSIIGKTAIDNLEDSSNITLISMAGPYDPRLKDVIESKAVLGFTYEKPTYTTYTFGGYFDTTVGRKSARLPGVSHKDVWSGHTWFLVARLPMLREVRERVGE